MLEGGPHIHSPVQFRVLDTFPLCTSLITKKVWPHSEEPTCCHPSRSSARSTRAVVEESLSEPMIGVLQTASHHKTLPPPPASSRAAFPQTRAGVQLTRRKKLAHCGQRNIGTHVNSGPLENKYQDRVRRARDNVGGNACDSPRGEGTGLSRESIQTGMRSDTRERREGRRRGIEKG